MSTAASVAQFTAILSGGGNNNTIATLRGQKGIAGNSPLLTPNTKIDFEALLSAATPEQREIIMQSPLFNNAGQSDNPAYILFNHIQNQGHQISKDIVKAELLKNNIPDDIIQKLQNMFTTSELTALVTDPKLKAQFETAIGDLQTRMSVQTERPTEKLPASNTNDITDILSIVITGILQQNKGRLENTITFMPSKEKTTDEGLKILMGLNRQPIDIPSTDTTLAVYAPAQLIPVEQKIQPLQLAIMQSQLNGQDLPPQAVTPVTGGVNPFAQIKSGKPAAPAINENNATPIQNGQTSNGSNQPQNQAIQSIADRLSAITQNADTNGKFDFSSQLTISADGSSLLADGDYLMPFSSGFKTAAQAANPLLSHASASQSNPATQLVAISLNKMAIKGANGEITQNFRIKLDPPELGKVDIEIDFLKDSQKIKAVIIVDKPETLGLLQRDMNHLLKSMHDAGFTDMTKQDFSFNLSSDNGGHAHDGKNHGDTHSPHGLSAANDVELYDDGINTQMSVIIDPITGQQSVNMLV